ncbi:two-partner secretion domain-containing protein [Cylindrospermum sp. FACHB-282]|uniref:two-partner secretion domain-containing protein n=1 Tax=Cylindrospermum sp. FACHB-282 TaxID=2692794 RepID=UPI001685FFC0|nr:filamentous hemagglutinin N-terminal domain-containing protein [Cylindrospermum sp. FACHB-282]MBD2384999.1 filamentous hemagglutinin N-terminal domain-containing protein [Cylindrospermum sp. FACHB-282]
MSNLYIGFPGLGLAISGVMAFSAHSAIAQITPDGTLPINSQVKTDEPAKTINIDGGTKSGSNLFHSFSQFSVPDGFTANFQKVENIQNIISRVTGGSISDIQGTLKAEGVNLFIINPNGIVFGPNASLQIGGSFIGSTASSVNFADGIFSATNPQSRPLLSVNVPIGLQFGATAAPIRNQSQAGPESIFRQPAGLKVNPGNTLALVGGDITLEGGNLTAESGRIELGSVTPNSLVSLNPIKQGWSLGYEGVKNFQNIRLIGRSVEGSMKASQVNTSSIDGSGGSIQVQGSTVELSGNGVRLMSLTGGDTDGEDITINARKLIVQDSAQVLTSTFGQGDSGNLTVNASESVELIGSATLSDNFTAFITATADAGKAGNIQINTGRLRILNGARVTAESARVSGDSQLIPAEGKGGNITVSASESVEVAGTSIAETPSVLAASSLNFGNAGTVNITTEKLTVRDGGEISVSVRGVNNAIYLGDINNPGTPGTLNISARSILLDNQGKLTSETTSGNGGNINLQVQDKLLMRRNSQISTSAGTAQADGDGGNITINAPDGFVIASPLGNNDITSNGFSGAGGRITVNANSIIGFVPRSRADLVRLLGTEEPDELTPQRLPTNEITAFSQQNPALNGVIQINTPDTDPKKLVELPEKELDVTGQIAAACDAPGKLAGGSFVSIGRGGIVNDPVDVLATEAVLTNWISLEGEGDNRAGGVYNSAVLQKQRNIETHAQKSSSVNAPEQIVEAQGWVIDAHGNVVLVAQAQTAMPHVPSLKQASCAAR